MRKTLTNLIERFLRRQTLFMVAFFLVSLSAIVVGLLDTPQAYNIYISAIVWFLLILIAFVFMIFIFPNMWKYSFFLVATYILSFFSIVLLITFDEIVYKIFGAIVFAISVGVCLIFMLQIRTVREIQGNYKYGDTNQHPLLGFWFMGAILFLGLSTTSTYMWVQWVKNNGLFLVYYVALEILIVLLFMYLLGYPEINFDWSAEEKLTVKKKGFISSIDVVVKTISKTKDKYISNSKSDSCPLCNSKFMLKEKKCPNCGGAVTFKWCSTSEEFFIKCRSCGSVIPYDRGACSNCNSKMSSLIACRHCGKEFELRDWE